MMYVNIMIIIISNIIIIYCIHLGLMKSSRSMRIHQIWVFGLHHLVRRSLEKISGLDQNNRCRVYFCVLKHEWGRHFFD